MNSKSLLASFLFLVLGYHASIAQLQDNATKRIAIQEVQVFSGVAVINSFSSDLNDFKALAPNSTLLKEDYQEFNSYQGYGTNGNPMLSMMVGIKFKNKNKEGYNPNRLLRLGINYTSGTWLEGGYSKSEYSPYDTLTSSLTGDQYFIDSVSTRSTSMYYSNEQIRLDGSFICRTDPEARWSLYAGIGLNVGLSFNARTQVEYYEYQYQDSDFGGVGSVSYSNFDSQNNIRKTETFRNQSGLNVAAFVPLGVNLRLGKTRDFWNKVNLFYELRPGIASTTIPELGSYVNSGVQMGMGIRVAW